ncbi:MAG: hypothetical protein ACRCWQ_03320 [Bacilli bacterium]
MQKYEEGLLRKANLADSMLIADCLGKKCNGKQKTLLQIEVTRTLASATENGWWIVTENDSIQALFFVKIELAFNEDDSVYRYARVVHYFIADGMNSVECMKTWIAEVKEWSKQLDCEKITLDIALRDLQTFHLFLRLGFVETQCGICLTYHNEA